MTRTTLLFSIFWWLSFPAHAQLEFAPIGAEWVFNNPVDGENIGHDPLEGWMSYQCTGDSTIGNQTYRKVGTMLFRQQGNKVYLRHEETDHLVFDFGLEVGDTTLLSIPICFFPTVDNSDREIQERIYIVHSIATITVGSQSLKKFVFLEYYNPGVSSDPVYEYTEKLGNSTWFVGECYIPTTFLFPWLRCYKDSIVDYKSEQLLSYGISDCYYLPPSSVEQPNMANKIVIAPNPVTDQLVINLEDMEVSDLIIYDLSGKPVYHQNGVQKEAIQIDCRHWPQGIYFCHAKCDTRLVQWKIVK